MYEEFKKFARQEVALWLHTKEWSRGQLIKPAWLLPPTDKTWTDFFVRSIFSTLFWPFSFPRESETRFLPPAEEVRW